MFKRFLKFFRSDENAPDEPFEGSYLDHLLTQVKPLVSAQLADEPDHDPLLLVVVGILRYTMMNAWSPKMRAPLVDSQSPGDRPPISALDDTLDAAVEREVTAEFDQPDAARPGEFDGDPDETQTDDETPAGRAESATDEEESEAAAIIDELAAPDNKAFRKTEEFDVDDIRAAQQIPPAAAQTMERETIEMDAIDPTVEIDPNNLFESQLDDSRPRVDSEEVLQAGRMFLGLLIENDRLPLELQLTVGETTVARDLLLGYFVGNTDFEEKARRLLTLVEQKFGEGLFSQARILLQLFHTDEQTRINNDRNLFYEDMILRLGIRRRHRLSAEELARFETLLEAATDPEGATEVTDWLAEKCLVRFQTFIRDPEDIDAWTDIVDVSTREGAQETFLKYLPARRWRPVDQYEGVDIVEQVCRHVSVDTAREYVISQLKSCYFVLRAVGDTGLEGYLDSFFDWSREMYQMDGTRLMPELYKRSMMDPEPMTVILKNIYEEYFEARTLELLDSWDEDDVTSALFGALQTFKDCDLGEIAPGYYDLGAFVYDELFHVKYPTAEFPFKIHRLT